jgi:ectoine hydroxylase-related dioxygenase (phytanoyl-CoA dioxygenase family)
MKSKAMADFIRNQGYAVFEDAVTPQFADELRETVLRLQAEDRDTYGRDYLYKIGQEGFVTNIGDRAECFQRLLEASPFAATVDELLGPNAVLYLFQGVIVPPKGGIGAYPWKWHADLYHVTQSVNDASFIPGINFLLYLEDVDASNGATWLLPGTQGLPEESLALSDPRYRASVEMQLKVKKGSAVMFNPLLWHCAGANNTLAPRCAIKMLMVRPWILPQMDYARSHRKSVVDQLSARARVSLGMESLVARDFKEHEALSAGQ